MFAFYKLNFTKLAFQNNMSSSAHSYANLSSKSKGDKLLFINKAINNKLLDEKNDLTHLFYRCLLRAHVLRI